MSCHGFNSIEDLKYLAVMVTRAEAPIVTFTLNELSYELS